MIAIPTASRVAAESTLTATGTVTRTAASTFDSGTGAITETTTTVWSGSCSIGPPGPSDRTSTGGDDRLIGTRVLRLPGRDDCATTTAGDPADVAVGDHLTITGDATTYVVRVVHDRTTSVLRRCHVVSLADAERVPR